MAAGHGWEKGEEGPREREGLEDWRMEGDRRETCLCNIVTVVVVVVI